MKRKLAKVISVLLIIAIIPCTSLSASAKSSVATEITSNVLRTSKNSGISTYAIKPPNNSSGSGETSLPYTAEPYPIYAGHTCYTLHYFKTSTGKITLNYHLFAIQPAVGERYVQFELLKGKKGFLWNVSWSTVGYRTIMFDDTIDEDATAKPHKTYNGTETFSNLEKNTMYCICIHNITPPDLESGYNYENAVAGTIEITE